MSGAGSSGAAAPTPLGSLEDLCPEISRLVRVYRCVKEQADNNDRFMKARKDFERDLLTAVKQTKLATTMSPAIKAIFEKGHLGGTETTARELAREMVECDRIVDEMGGMEAIKKMQDELLMHEKRKAAAKSISRASTCKIYNETLEEHGLVKNSIYRVAWKGLVDSKSGDALDQAFSFAIVGGSCEAKDRNGDADPTKIRLRLTFYPHGYTNELYVAWDDSVDFMVPVNASNVKALCDSVFDDDVVPDQLADTAAVFDDNVTPVTDGMSNDDEATEGELAEDEDEHADDGNLMDFLGQFGD